MFHGHDIAAIMIDIVASPAGKALHQRPCEVWWCYVCPHSMPCCVTQFNKDKREFYTISCSY